MFDLSIVTPEKIFYEDKISSLIIPATLGYLGVLTNHAPLLTGLVPGKITIKDQQGERRLLAVSGGFAEVLKNRVTILADTVEFPDKIDFERAQRALDRAKERLKSREKGIDIPRAMTAYRRAKNRIDICKTLSSSE
jgi:F-type H+-transporting ATPase subunit epsilon